MFPRILLDDETWLMTLDWFGMGRLRVSNWNSQRTSIAPSSLKSHMLNTIHSLGRLGWSIQPSNPDLKTVLRSYAAFVLNPEALVSRAILSQSPHEVAAVWVKTVSSKGPSPNPAIAAIPRTYYDWEEAKITCPTCRWVGQGSECVTGETFNEGIEKHCPRCDYRFGFVMYPLIEEAASDPRASIVDQAIAQHQLASGESACVLATTDRSIVWVMDSQGLFEVREHGQWGATGHCLMDRINDLLPINNEEERLRFLLEARAHAV